MDVFSSSIWQKHFYVWLKLHLQNKSKTIFADEDGQGYIQRKRSLLACLRASLDKKQASKEHPWL